MYTKSLCTLIASAAVVSVLATPSPGADAISTLSLDDAYGLAKSALEQCRVNGYPNSAVAVTDKAGVVVVLLREPGAPEPTAESARRKAYTSAKTGMSTAEFAKSKNWVDTNPPPRPQSSGAPPAAPPGAGANPFANLPVFDNDPNLVPWGGGLTLKSGSAVVGGIGLSGAAGGQKDEDCVKAAAESFNKAHI